MSFKPLAALRSFFRPLFRLLGMSSAQRFAEFPSNTHGDEVMVWADRLVQMYCLEDPTLGPCHRARRPMLRVIEIRLYKEAKFPEHEYLVVRIDVPHSAGSFIHIERTIPEVINDSSANSSTSSLSRTIANGSSHYSQLSMNKLDALDIARTVPDWPADIAIAQINCSDVLVTLLDIALAAQLVHHHSGKYQLLKRQCYWFADTNAGILAKFFNVPEKQLLPSTRTPEATNRDSVPIKDRTSGCIKQFRIHERDQTTIDELVGLFRGRKEDVERKILAAHDTCNERLNEVCRLNEAVSQAQKEVSRAKEEARRAEDRAEEEVSRAKEEARRAEDRAEEEARRAEEEVSRAKEEARRAKDRAEEEARRAEEEVDRAKEEARRAKEEAHQAKEEARRAKEETERLNQHINTLGLANNVTANCPI